MHARTILHILFSLILLGTFPQGARAAEQDETLTLLGQPLVSNPAAGRLPRQFSHTAENTTLVDNLPLQTINNGRWVEYGVRFRF